MDEPASSLVVVGASAGGVEALKALAAGLPEYRAASVCVVRHFPAIAESRLAEILRARRPASRIPGAGRRDTRLRPHPLAPPDRHLLVQGPARSSCAARARTASVRRSTRCSAAQPPPTARAWSASSSRGRATTASSGRARSAGAAARPRAGPRGRDLPRHAAETISGDHPDQSSRRDELPAAIAAAVTRVPGVSR